MSGLPSVAFALSIALLLVQLLTLPGGDGQGDGQQPKTKAA